MFVKTSNKWYCYTTEDEIEDLLARLTDKGINESALIINLNKLTKKKLKLLKKNTIAEDNPDLVKQTLAKAIEWRNQSSGNPKLKNKVIEKENRHKVADILCSIEERMSEYLLQHGKELESQEHREELVRMHNIRSFI